MTLTLIRSQSDSSLQQQSANDHIRMRAGLRNARCMEDSDHDEFTISLSPPTFVHEAFSAERTGLGSVRPSKDFHHNRKKMQSRFITYGV